MLRRVSLAILLGLFCATSAWPKWKPEEQEYLDNQFRTIQEQIQALKKQNDALAAQLAQMRQDQAEFQAVVVRQQRKLDDLEQLVSSLRIGNEENFSIVKTAIGKLRDQQEKSFNDLIGRSAQTAAAVTTPAVASPPAAAPPQPVVKGYVTGVKGDTLTLDVGSSQGIHEGSKLQLFKATDLNTPVGELEVTDVPDSSTSHARVVSLTPGVKAEFSDIVRPEP
jgi:hypothetical protein